MQLACFAIEIGGGGVLYASLIPYCQGAGLVAHARLIPFTGAVRKQKFQQRRAFSWRELNHALGVVGSSLSRRPPPDTSSYAEMNCSARAVEDTLSPWVE